MLRRLLAVLLLSTAGACACRKPAPPPAAPPQATTPLQQPAAKIAVVGDFGLAGEAEAQVSKLIHSWSPDAIITTGDNNYPHGKRDTFDVNIGDYYYDFIKFDAKYAGPHKSHGSATQRFFPAMGNHDWYSGEGDAPHRDYFDLPGNERYYQVRFGPVEVFVLDSDPKEPDGVEVNSTQALWLQQALTKSQAPWKLVTMHHPPYSRGEHRDNAWMQWPYKAWGATAVLAGHDHDYERIVMDNFPYWVVGTGGAPMRGFSDQPYANATADIMYEHKHGAMLIDATAERLLFRFFNTDSELIDTYEAKATALN